MKKEIRKKIEFALEKAKEEAGSANSSLWRQGVEYISGMTAEDVFEILRIDWTEEGMEALTEADIISAIFDDERKFSVHG